MIQGTDGPSKVTMELAAAEPKDDTKYTYDYEGPQGDSSSDWDVDEPGPMPPSNPLQSPDT